jgi:hypothetical protein
MEDENRPLPDGWVRQFDPEEGHQFFVDTKANPPRSTWLHPYDDPEYLATLDPEERKRHTRRHRAVTLEDVTAEDTDGEDDHDHHTSQLPPRDGQAAQNQPGGLRGFGRKMKDKITGSTHEQRDVAHLRARQAMMKALQTGEPQFLAKDQQGRDLYVMPPNTRSPPAGGHGLYPFGHGSPYASYGPTMYRRPMMPYGRPVGYGYGGGFGAPLAGGFLGGALLGSLMF